MIDSSAVRAHRARGGKRELAPVQLNETGTGLARLDRISGLNHRP